MLDTPLGSQSLSELLRQLDSQHAELSEALERGAIADARRLQAALMQTARSIDKATPSQLIEKASIKLAEGNAQRR